MPLLLITGVVLACFRYGICRIAVYSSCAVARGREYQLVRSSLTHCAAQAWVYNDVSAYTGIDSFREAPVMINDTAMVVRTKGAGGLDGMLVELVRGTTSAGVTLFHMQAYREFTTF